MAEYTHRYLPLLRPAGFSTLPSGIAWDYLEEPAMCGLANRPDLPRSQHRFGVIGISRALTSEEAKTYDLRGL